MSQVAPDLDPHIEYNITHDNDLVAMAFTSGDQQTCNNIMIGIDIMKVRIPGHESFASFVDCVGDQVGYPLVCALCSLEHECVTVNSNGTALPEYRGSTISTTSALLLDVDIERGIHKSSWTRSWI